MKAADLSTEEFLGFIRGLNVERRADGGAGWVLMWDLEARWPEVPYKVLLAKARILIRKKKLNGCGCGCRGDFVLPDLDVLAPKEETT